MKKAKTITGVEIVDMAAKGDVIGKKEGITYLVKGGVPGDVATIEVKRKKKGMPLGQVKAIEALSEHRIDARCEHFEHCGGCNWQNLDYQVQVNLKDQRARQQLLRIGGITPKERLDILSASELYEYRNKLEFTFVSQRWLKPEEIASGESIEDRRACGFHVPGRFDWVLQVNQCHLQDQLHNDMRNHMVSMAKEREIPFYHPRDKVGTMRNVLFRNNRNDEWMVILVVRESTQDVLDLCNEFVTQYDQIKSFWLIVNEKVNDSFSDCPAELIYGEPQIVEQFKRPDGTEVRFNIGPKSFFQTNPNQAERLYQLVYEWADLKGDERLYDLYTGTGSIALFLADRAKEVIGVEYVPEAIEDAKENAELNGIDHCQFFAGDMKEVLNDDFIAKYGAPDVMVCDPPRAGMHEDVIQCILNAKPKKLVYVSCDPATQARDVKLLATAYEVERAQAVDLFPHTSHVEQVLLLTLKG